MWEKTREVLIESIGRMQEALARFLPALLAAVLILVVAVLLSALVRALLRRACARLELERRSREWGLVAPGRESRLSLWVERLGSWSVLAVGLLLALSVFDAGATSALSVRLLEYVPHVLFAVIIVAAGATLSRALERAVLIGAVNMGIQSARFLGLGARWLVVVMAAAMALDHLGVGGIVLPMSFGIVFGGIVLALSLAVGLGARDMVARSLERRFGPRPEAEADEEEKEDDLRHM
jgi:hypothetical protein